MAQIKALQVAVQKQKELAEQVLPTSKLCDLLLLGEIFQADSLVYVFANYNDTCIYLLSLVKHV